MGNLGIKVSKLNQEVRVSKTKNTRFSSAALSPKINKIIFIDVTVPASTGGGTNTTVTKAHGLSYIPAYMPFLKKANILYPVQARRSIGGVIYQFDTAIDGTNVYARVRNVGVVGGSDVIFNFKFYILTDKLT